MRKILALIAVVALTACSFPTSDPAAEALATKAYQQFSAGEDAALTAEFAAHDKPPEGAIARLRAILPKGQPSAPKLVGFNSFAGTGGSTLTLTHQYDYPDGAQVTTSTVMAKDPKVAGGWVLRGFNVNVQVAGVGAPTSQQPQAPQPPKKPAPKPPVA